MSSYIDGISSILIYKRTHPFDPDTSGRFGVADCMGRIRDQPFEAVIGVGGSGAAAQRYGIAFRVNWIGIGPHRRKGRKRGSIVTFDHFLKLEEAGPLLKELAPSIAKRLFDDKVRCLRVGLTADQLEEARDILRIALSAHDSNSRSYQHRPRDRACRSSH